MDIKNLIIVFAGIALIISVVNLGFTINKFSDFAFTGLATDTGTANVTIETGASVSFNISIINWGTGYVNSTADYAILSSQGVNANGTDFTTVFSGLVLRNDGNVNVSVDLNATNNATDFIGGANPVYQWNVSNNETGSCLPTTNISVYTNANTSLQLACLNLGYVDTMDQLRIDVRVQIPSDAPAEVKGSIITAIATAI